MKKKFKILIADRNPHVREFLRREMAGPGYRVRLAENGREVLKFIYGDEFVDLLILDPDLPDTDAPALLRKLQNRLPYIPVVLHTFIADLGHCPDIFNVVAVVEKGGSSVERLKTVVYEILAKDRAKEKIRNNMQSAGQKKAAPATGGKDEQK
ncbi:hypothetical protein DENIS_3263 [Desulfonema ishimotonii]|uniref:Response regulatory domain-containing protein n=1 Tax=Desulfonema ishimotonii TaxID=45657 RepID=A0A401FZA5_9BACT|nr:response regulator [Desulfonema ishimotonii]GBC62294.1 hypothetical protein DENIS_3263 [Desulfonema ishimotonii]